MKTLWLAFLLAGVAEAGPTPTPTPALKSGFGFSVGQEVSFTASVKSSATGLTGTVRDINLAGETVTIQTYDGATKILDAAQAKGFAQKTGK